MRASATYTAIGASATGQRKLDLTPQMHMIADLNKEKLNLHLNHPIMPITTYTPSERLCLALKRLTNLIKLSGSITHSTRSGEH